MGVVSRGACFVDYRHIVIVYRHIVIVYRHIAGADLGGVRWVRTNPPFC